MLLTTIALSLIAAALLWTSIYHAAIYVLSIAWRGSRPPGEKCGGAILSVVIPAKNEPVSVLERSLKSFFSGSEGMEAEVILVLDDPVERVSEIVKQLHPIIDQGKVTVLARMNGAHGRNGAIVDGMRFSLGQNLMVVDADCIVSKEVLAEASNCCGVCVARWKPYLVYSTPVEEAMAFLTDYGSWLLYEKRYEAGFFLYPLGSGTVLSRRLASTLGYWPTDALQDDIRLGTILASHGVEPNLLRSRVQVSVPATLSAVRVQQSRWAFGTCDVLRRFGKLVLKSSLPLHKKLEAYLYMATPLASVASTGGFALSIAAALKEAHLPLSSAWAILAAAAFSMLVEGFLMRRFASEEGWVRGRAIFLMGRVAALTTLMSPIVAAYALLGLGGVKVPYRITPKSLEKKRVPDFSILLMLALALATLLPSALNFNVPVLLLGLLELSTALYAAKRFAWDVAAVRQPREAS